MATKTESTVQVPWAVTTEQRAPALQITVPKCTYVLPWSRFLYAEGDSSEIRAFFITHDFVVQGCGLGHLFTELAAQRVTVLKQPIRPIASRPRAPIPRCKSPVSKCTLSRRRHESGGR